jgi:hypothetical protein
MVADDGPAFLAAAVRAAVLARAPRRTVQGVAAAVAGVFANNLPSARATPTTDVRRQPADIPGVARQAEEDSSPEALMEALRAARRERRICKKKRRMATKAAKVACATSLAVDVAMTSREEHDDSKIAAVVGEGDCESECPGRETAISGAPSMSKRRRRSCDVPGVPHDQSGCVLMAVCADEPLEVEVQAGEGINDYWADAPIVVKGAAPCSVEGMLQRTLQKDLARQKRYLTAVCSNAALGRGSAEATRARNLILGIEARLALEDPNLAGVVRRDG